VYGLTLAAPEITEEYGNDIEAVIRRRIRDGLFDDVERKAKPLEQVRPTFESERERKRERECVCV
jgi:U3 small nucleolar ribonucleoprotein component